MRLTFRWRSLTAALRDAWPAWLAVAGVVSAYVFGRSLSSKPADALRYTGTFLQVLGLATVARGLHQTRSLFDQPSLRASMANWFRRLAGAFTAPKPTSVKVSLAGASIRVFNAQVDVGIGSQATLVERVEKLEENLKRLQGEVDSRVQGLRQELGTVKESIERESQGRREADEKTARRIEEMAIGGIHLEVVGLLWLFLGVIAAGIPDLIAVWFSRFA